jgi:hypothetical protein
VGEVLVGATVVGSGVRVGAVFRDGSGVGTVLVSRGGSASASASRTRGALSGTAPAPSPPGARASSTMEVTLGRWGVTSISPNWAPSHIAGPSPTAMMAPKSAIGPRSITAPPLVDAIVDDLLGSLLPVSANGKRITAVVIVTQSDDTNTLSSQI